MQRRSCEKGFLKYIVSTVVRLNAPFDAKLKSLQILKKILEKEIKVTQIATNVIAETLIR